jgi:hypothetical protein
MSTQGPLEITRGRIRTPRSIRAGLDEHPLLDILGNVLVGQVARFIHIACLALNS